MMKFFKHLFGKKKNKEFFPLKVDLGPPFECDFERVVERVVERDVECDIDDILDMYGGDCVDTCTLYSEISV